MSKTIKVTVEIMVENLKDDTPLTEAQIDEFFEHTKVDFSDAGDVFVMHRFTSIEDYEILT